MGADDAFRLEPNLSPSVQGGLFIPRESVVDPFSVSIAYCEVAVSNGVDVVFGIRVSGVEDAMKNVMKNFSKIKSLLKIILNILIY